MEKLSYALGMVIGHNLKNMSVNEINAADFAAAVSDVLAGNTTKIDDAEAQQIVNTFLQKQQEEMGKAVREDGERFLAENAKKKGVVTTKSGLQYEVLTEGKGDKPRVEDVVTVNYVGSFIDGKEFENTWQTKEPARFVMMSVIPGLAEGVALYGMLISIQILAKF